MKSYPFEKIRPVVHRRIFLLFPFTVAYIFILSYLIFIFTFAFLFVPSVETAVMMTVFAFPAFFAVTFPLEVTVACIIILAELIRRIYHFSNRKQIHLIVCQPPQTGYSRHSAAPAILSVPI